MTNSSTLDDSITKSQKSLWDQRFQDGYWWYTLEANDSINAETIMMHYYLGIDDPDTINGLCNWLIHNQNENGSWSLYHDDQGDISTTVECYFALKLAGHAPSQSYMEAARQFILEKGGITKVRIFTRIHLALFELVGWSKCPKMPVGLIQLPYWSPVNIYEFSSWARASIVPLLVIMDQKKSIPSPVDLNELYVEKNPIKAKWQYDGDRSLLSIENAFIYVDKALQVAELLKLKPLQKSSLQKCELYIRTHIKKTEDIFPALFYGILALHALGYDLNDSEIQSGLNGLKSFRMPAQADQKSLPELPAQTEQVSRPLLSVDKIKNTSINQDLNSDILYQQCCISPIWDTAWAGVALLESGVHCDDPRILETARWLVDKQVTETKGDWAIKNPSAKPGGWSFEFINDYYPDVDDTLEVLTFLYHSNLPFKELYKSFELGLDWLLSMQSSDGGFAAFDKNNNLELLNKIPFSDHGACLDPSTADITGRVIEFMVKIANYNSSAPFLQKAADFLVNCQEPDGSFWGRWGVNYIYGTWCALGGLCALNRPEDELTISRSIKWLKDIQNEDGGFGETCHSYIQNSYLPLGHSTASQTAWALMGFVAAGEAKSQEAQNAAHYLLSNQNADGNWDEKDYTGAGFPGHFYIRYHGYRNYFPLLALAQYRKALTETKNN